MVANPNKFQLMFLGTRKKTKLCLSIGDKTCVSSSSVTLLGVETGGGEPVSIGHVWY